MQRHLRWLPIVGIIIFVGIYFFAASIYPGGTKLDPGTIGYNHFANFWCDLTDRITYLGKPNPARWYALAGTVLLPMTLIPFWIYLPRLFDNSRWVASTSQLTGVLAMIAAAFVPLAHDLMVNILCFFIAIAFGGALLGLLRGKQFLLLGVALVSVGLFAEYER